MTSTEDLQTGGDTLTDANLHQPHTSRSSNEVKKSTRLMTIDVCLLSVPLSLLFTSVASLGNLQSSVNASLGTASMSVIYVAQVLSAAFLSTWMISKLGQKITITVSLLFSSAYIAVQFYPVPYTLLPAAFLFGLVKSPLLTAQYSLLTGMGSLYAELTGANIEACITRFFGIFFLIFLSCNVSGNLISSQVVPSDPPEANSSSVPALLGCGATFCERSQGNRTSSDISEAQRQTLAAIGLTLALMAPVAALLFSNSYKRYQPVSPTIKPSTRNQFFSTFRQMKKPYQLLMIPMLMWSGVQPTFMTADYTDAYVSCVLGVHMVGYTMVCYGVCDAISSILCSPVVKWVGRKPVFLFAAALNGGLIAFLFYWEPSPNHLPVFFVVSGLWGVSHAAWHTQAHALCGLMFGHDAEAAFSVYEMWLSVGHIVAYVCSSLLCVTSKIFVMLAFYSFAVAGYLLIEFLEWLTRQSNTDRKQSL